MRILYFTRSDSVHDQRFMAALAESGHEAYVLRLYEGDYKTPEGVSAIAFKGIKGPLRLLQIPGLVARLKKLLEELKPDLVHAGPLHDLAYLIAKTGYKPLLSMSWGFDLMRDVIVDAG
ncbi:MAG: glycosyltransferase, partial [Chloroflexi bacterium]|nr:glycosyltransferase [Chloroflexota bacterium]